MDSKVICLYQPFLIHGAQRHMFLYTRWHRVARSPLFLYHCLFHGVLSTLFYMCRLRDAKCHMLGTLVVLIMHAVSRPHDAQSHYLHPRGASMMQAFIQDCPCDVAEMCFIHLTPSRCSSLISYVYWPGWPDKCFSFTVVSLVAIGDLRFERVRMYRYNIIQINVCININTYRGGPARPVKRVLVCLDPARVLDSRRSFCEEHGSESESAWA